jgi:hypothetical protein
MSIDFARQFFIHVLFININSKFESFMLGEFQNKIQNHFRA